MTQYPDTRQSLLARVKDPCDEEAWGRFVAVYRPIVYRLARRLGLQDADSDDLAQQVMLIVRRAIGRWDADPAKGRFHSWLGRIARNATINALSRRRPDRAAGGTSALGILQQQPEPSDRAEDSLPSEYRRSLFRWAAGRIRLEFHEETWRAFWLTTVDGVAVEEAARALGKTLGSVYAARSRVMRRLKDEIERNDFVGRD